MKSNWLELWFRCAVVLVIGGLCDSGLSASEQVRASFRKKSKSAKKNDRQNKAGVNAKGRKTRYTFRHIHDPDGIGKFYLGREIASVMGYGFQGSGAQWLERRIREQEENLSLLIKSLKLKPMMIVADIGAGSGVVTVLMAEHLLPGGQVIAVDIQQEMLKLLRKKLDQLRITNVKLVKGTIKSPRLKPKSIDLVIMVDVYHEFIFPFEMMLEVSKALKPSGRVAIVEYRKEDPTVPIKLVHKMTEAQVKKEIGQSVFGLKWIETIDVLPRQHIIVFQKLKSDGTSTEATKSRSPQQPLKSGLGG